MVGSENDDPKRVALEEIASDPMLGPIFEVWQTKRGGRFAPHPSDMGALALPPAALPRIVLVDVIDRGARFRFRLMGSAVALSSGKDFTGQFVDEALSGWVRDAVLQDYRTVVARKRPLYAVAEIRLPEGHSVKNCRLVVPLSTDGAEVDRLLLVSRTTSDWQLPIDLQRFARDHARDAIRSFTVL